MEVWHQECAQCVILIVVAVLHGELGWIAAKISERSVKEALVRLHHVEQ